MTESVPFALSYPTTGGSALSEDILAKAHNSVVIVIGHMTGQVDVQGLVRITPDALVVEYRAVKAQVGSLMGAPRDPELHTISVPINAIGSIALKSRFLRKPVLVIEFSRLDVVPALPWSQTTRLELPVARRDAVRAREVVVTVRNRIADALLARPEYRSELPGEL